MTTAPAATNSAPQERVPVGAYPFGAFAAQSILGVRPSAPAGRSGSA